MATRVNREEVREYPKNIEAEQVCLGSAILEPESTVPALLEVLLPEHFYERRHRVIFAAIRDLFNASEPADIVILANKLEELGDMELAGGRMYLNELLDRTTTTASLEYYRDIVKRKATLREVIQIGGRITEVGFDEESTIEDVLDKAEGLMFSVSEKGYGQDNHVLLADYLPIRIGELSEINSGKNKTGIVGYRTGIEQLDRMLGGLHKSDLVIVAGRPGTGKSSFCTTVASRCSIKEGAKVAIFSLEMRRDQVTDRMLSTVGLANLHKMRNGLLSFEAFRGVNEAASRLVKTKVVIDDSPAISILELRSKARKFSVEHRGLDIVIVDYIQLVEGGKSVGKREEEVAFVTRSLKKLARELNVVVIACSQLNRNGSKRGVEDRRPILEDLRESGAIEQDADGVIFIHRPGFNGEENQTDQDAITEVELILAKQRNGPTGIIRASFHKSHSSFVNLLHEDRKVTGFGVES